MGFQLHSQLEVETDIKSVALFKEKKQTLNNFLIYRVTFQLMLCRTTICAFPLGKARKNQLLAPPLLAKNALFSFEQIPLVLNSCT